MKDQVNRVGVFPRVVLCWLLLLLASGCRSVAVPQAQAPPAHPGRSEQPAASAPAALPAKSSVAPLNTAAERFAARAQLLLNAGPASKGEWGILILDAGTADVLYQLNADRYFVPASNMKLFTTSLALATLGPAYRFHTTVEAAQPIDSQGVLPGELVLVGRGDPNLSNRKFPYDGKEEFDGSPDRVIAEFADALLAKGLKKVSGDIVGDDSYFPRERYPSGWEIDDMVWEYGAAISAIVVDDNTVTAELTPGNAPGDPVLLSVDPPTAEFTIVNQVVTSARGVKADLTLTREPGSNQVVVKGALPAHASPRKLQLAIQEPALHAAAMLKRLLEQRGVVITGAARARHERVDSPGAPSVVLAEHVSIPLSDSVKLVNKISQNLHTEVLLRTAARQKGLWTTPEDLVKFPEAFYASAGIAPNDVIQTDGSGLSRHDLVTPRAIVSLLQFARTQTWFTPFYASLPVAGLDGTLENNMKGTVAAGRIHAKTGSVEHVRTRSGYAETPAGRHLIFSFMANNQGGTNHEASDVLDGLSVAMLEEFDEPTPPCCKR